MDPMLLNVLILFFGSLANFLSHLEHRRSVNKKLKDVDKRQGDVERQITPEWRRNSTSTESDAPMLLMPKFETKEKNEL